MKTRKGFVSNSSSSSFIIVTAGNETILEDGNTDLEQCGSTTIDIDVLIEKLLAAKEKGVKEVSFDHGGGYEG